MLLITENVFVEYLRINKAIRLDEVINIKKFKISDTQLTYRKANDLDSNNLLDRNRTNKLSWRKFSFKELVYVDVVVELKEFGLKSEQLKPLWESFFKESLPKLLEKSNKADAEIAIGCVLGGVEIILNVDNKGNIIFADPHNLMLSINPNPQIKVPFNEVVNNLLPKLGLTKIPITHSLQSLIFDNSAIVTLKEKELLRIIRKKEYSAVKVKKKDGEIAIVYAERHNNKSNFTDKDLITLLKSKDYADISIVQRDGKIMSYKIEETVKL